jgi:hypothetical protein
MRQQVSVRRLGTALCDVFRGDRPLNNFVALVDAGHRVGFRIFGLFELNNAFQELLVLLLQLVDPFDEGGVRFLLGFEDGLFAGLLGE